MRLKRYDDAVRQFHSFVMQAGSTWTKPGLPVIFCTNFATALLLAGLADGARNTLNEIQDQNHASVKRLRDFFHRWKASLGLWSKFKWSLGLLPDGLPPIDFVPGEFVESMISTSMPPGIVPAAKISTARVS